MTPLGWFFVGAVVLAAGSLGALAMAIVVAARRADDDMYDLFRDEWTGRLD